MPRVEFRPRQSLAVGGHESNIWATSVEPKTEVKDGANPGGVIAQTLVVSTKTSESLSCSTEMFPQVIDLTGEG